MSENRSEVINHYKTLGVADTATQEEIRRAYHDEARRWHPDRYVDSAPSGLAEATQSMGRVNEAWRVLGDPQRRADFDRQLALRTPRARASGISVQDDIIRIDPRLLDPQFLADRRRNQEQEFAAGQAAVLRLVPWIALGGILVAIFIFSAFARRSDSSPPATAPGPAIGVDAGACVRIATGPSLLSVPCDSGSLYDGRVIGARFSDGTCPVGTTREVPLTEDKVVCLGP